MHIIYTSLYVSCMYYIRFFVKMNGQGIVCRLYVFNPYVLLFLVWLLTLIPRYVLYRNYKKYKNLNLKLLIREWIIPNFWFRGTIPAAGIVCSYYILSLLWIFTYAKNYCFIRSNLTLPTGTVFGNTLLDRLESTRVCTARIIKILMSGCKQNHKQFDEAPYGAMSITW